MSMTRFFEEYVGMGVVKKCSSDASRARFLISEAGKSMEGLIKRVRVMSIEDDNANSIVKDCHDIIMELLRAKLLSDGFNAAGNFAHEAEVSYLRKLGFSDNDVLFANDLRYFRNSITYYGKSMGTEYAEKAVSFTKRVYPALLKLSEKAVK